MPPRRISKDEIKAIADFLMDNPPDSHWRTSLFDPSPPVENRSLSLRHRKNDVAYIGAIPNKFDILFDEILEGEEEMSYDIPTRRDERSWSTPPAALPKSGFESESLESKVAKKIKNIVFTINKLDIENFYISGGLATACIFGHFVDYKDFDKRFDSLFGDIDVYVSTAQFEKLVKAQMFKQVSPGMLEYDCTELKRKIQILNMKDRTIDSIVSDFDFSLNMCYLTLEIYEKPKISYHRLYAPKNYFQTVYITNVGNTAKSNSLDRAVKYHKRFPSIVDFIIKATSVEKLLETVKATAESETTESVEDEGKPTKMVSSLKRFNKLEFDK